MHRRVLLTLLVLLVAGCSSSRPSTKPAASIKGPPLSLLTTHIKQQLSGAGTDDYDIAGIATVTCDPPSSWTTGTKFKCYAYGYSQTELGVYTATITPGTSKQWAWSASWQAKETPTTTPPTTPTTVPPPTTPSTAPVNRSAIAAFNSFANRVKNDLALCTAGAADVQIEVGGLLVNPSSATNAELVQLDNDSKSAQTACDEAKDDRLDDLATLSPPSPISYIQSLSNAASDALLWATDDTTAVLHDLQRLAESTGSAVAIESQLTTDVAQADNDAGSVRYSFTHAAQRLGITNFGGLGLVFWSS